MILPPCSSHQPVRLPWTIERLQYEHSIALGSVLEPCTKDNYSSALQAYLEFCQLHDCPITPTPDTFSYFIVFQSAHIKAQSVAVSMSGIVRELEDHFPDVQSVQSHPLVVHTLTGCLKRHASPIQHKRLLCLDDLLVAYDCMHRSTALDDELFLVQLHVGFDALLHCGKLTWPDLQQHQSTCKLPMHHTLVLGADCLCFTLPSHKADQFGDGNSIFIHPMANMAIAPHAAGHWSSNEFQKYIQKHLFLLNAMIHAG
ncbi:hypothetical protein BDN67DRAFT_909983 [Paxillus ammoniavirescens]|nr:hypothetical protein BDN67DRAFT_909983 [Paxillus ammoniavirescens]